MSAGGKIDLALERSGVRERGSGRGWQEPSFRKRVTEVKLC